jgi:SAM-dependent methyltransferase
MFLVGSWSDRLSSCSSGSDSGFWFKIMSHTRDWWQKLKGKVLRATSGSGICSKLRCATLCVDCVSGKRGLEIGGPSSVFRDERFIPVYAALKSLDGCNFRSGTIWEGALTEGLNYQFFVGKANGYQYLAEATDLGCIGSDQYDVLLSAHMLEHSANPIKALREWIRVVRPDGYLLLVLPHRDGTFDHRRPVTPLSHLIQDYESGISEADLTHLKEVLELHDLTRDRAAGNREAFHGRCLQNIENRGLHHHVFDLRAAIELVDHAGLQLLAAETAKPHHVVMLAKKCSPLDNRAFLKLDSTHFARSPFGSDRRGSFT